MKQISVIIPTFNCAIYVTSAVQSVLDQSYENTEIIVVDDGSTDETRDLIQPFLKDIIYIHQDNKGLPGARNRGLQEASGDYVAFLDADDRWRKNKLEIQIKVFESCPSVHIVFSNFSIFDEAGHKEESYFQKAFPIFYENRFNLKDIFQNTYNLFSSRNSDDIKIYHGHIVKHLFYGNFILPSSVLIRKSVIDHMGGFDESYKIAEETEFFLRVCTKYEAAYVDRPLVDYLIKRIGNLTGSSNTERLIRNAIIIQGDYLLKHPYIYDLYKKYFDVAVAKSYTRLAYYYMTMSRNKDARNEAINSISWNPYQMQAYLYALLTYCPPALLRMAGRFKQLIKIIIK